MKYKALIGILGMDQHETGAIIISKILRDAGIEVIYIGPFNTPSSIVQSAIAEDVDIIGISAHSWEYIHFIPELIELLKKEAVNAALIIGGSVITADDARYMLNCGVEAVFGPDTDTELMVKEILNLCERKNRTL